MKSKPYPPVGKLIDIGTHRLHIHLIGHGGPTVILEAGGLGWSLDWHLVQTEVAKFTRVCSYDRAGFGWSDPGPCPRTSKQIVAELHTLLEKAEIGKPYILVGASFGGHTVRLYSKTYPDEVAGIVLVDARHEAIDAKMPPSWKKLQASGKGVCQVMLMVSRLRLLDLLGELGGEKSAPPILAKLPPQMRVLYLNVGFQPKYFQSNLDELEAVSESDRQLSATGSLGSLPLTVIRHGLPEMFASMPTHQAQQAEQVWQVLQVELAKMSSNSQMLVAEKSGHRIPIDQPDVVVTAIMGMVQMVRSEK